jgi:glycosyltransferase involved in cell wall biosynthesis
MRICLVSQQLGTIRTGLGTYANTLVPALVAAGHEAVVVGRGVPPAGVAEFHAVPRVIGDPTPEGWLTFAWLAARRVRVLARCDVVHFLDAREALCASRGAGPLVGTAHDCYLASAPGSLAYWRARYTDWAPRYLYHHAARRLERRALAKLDRLLCNSRYVERALATHYEVRARTVYYGFTFPWPAVAAPRGREVLFIGVNFQRKGLPALLEALAEVAREVPDVRLRVVGDHPTRPAMEALARRLGVHARVTFAGLVAHEALGGLFLQARVLALPSEVEGFGITLLEAMHCGLPVIASTEGGGEELVEQGVTGFLVQPGDVSQLAARLRELLLDDALAGRLGQAGRTVAQRFSPARMVSETVATYVEVAA